MSDFTTITYDEAYERVTSPMPADETVVRVKLKDGTETDAWFSCNIMEPGDWDFLPVLGDGEPDMAADSIMDKVVAWRRLALPTV